MEKFSVIMPPEETEANPACIERMANGDGDAFEWLYKNYNNRLYDYALLLTQDKFLAEDVMHDVFLKIWITRDLSTITSVLTFHPKKYRITTVVPY